MEKPVWLMNRKIVSTRVIQVKTLQMNRVCEHVYEPKIYHNECGRRRIDGNHKFKLKFPDGDSPASLFEFHDFSSLSN